MNRRFPFAAAVSVLGAVVCIALLAFLAGCGGEGPASAKRVVVQFTGQTTTVDFRGAVTHPVARQESGLAAPGVR